MISSLSILNYVDMDSESSVLGYGVSLIVLNAMMYVGIPMICMLSNVNNMLYVSWKMMTVILNQRIKNY